MNRNKIGSLYIHIPFCRKKCGYCDFYSIDHSPEIAAKLVESLISLINPINQKFDTIYIGGGTPTVLEKSILEKLIRSLRKNIKGSTEFTIEANPESMDHDKLKLLFDNGVNRLSIGAQSLNDGKLAKLGRVHDSAKALDAIDISLKSGFTNIGADFIFGVWGESIDEWKEDLAKAIKLPLKHISCYSLTYEAGTRITKDKDAGKISILPEEVVLDMFEYAIDYLPGNGFGHYEVSNFAKPGFESRHNMNYWQNNEYFGLGPSAVSFVNGIRSKNTPYVNEYIKRVDNKEDLSVSREKLDRVRFAKETAAVKIRTAEGINFDWFKKKTELDFMELEGDALKSLVKDGLLELDIVNGGGMAVRLTKKGFIFCDSVSEALL